jgi:hypothetical protein
MLRRTSPYSCVVALLLLNSASVALAQVAGPPSPVTLTTAESRADFDQLRAALEEAHGGLYRHTPKPALDSAFAVLRARLDGDRSVSRRELVVLLSELIARIGDGHAHLELGKSTEDELRRAPLLPLRVLVEDSALVVTLNYSTGDSTIQPGMQLVTIDDHDARDVLQLMLRALPGDGFIESGKRASVGNAFAEHYRRLVSDADSFTVVARDTTGRRVTARLAGVPRPEWAAERNPVNARMLVGEHALWRPDSVVALRFVDEGRVAQLRVRWFDGEDFPRRIEDAFHAIRERSARALVLDLRGNPGGVDEYGALLVSRLVATPFRYFDRIHLASTKPSFNTWRAGTSERIAAGVVADPAGGWLVTPAMHPGVGIQQPASEPYLGRVVVLMDGGTFSTAADVCAVLRGLGRATFVGTETGGGYEGNTSGLNALVTVRHSGLGLKVPMYGYWNAVPAPVTRSRGTMPDHVVAERVADLLRGVDAPWDAALGVARQGTERTSDATGERGLRPGTRQRTRE